MAPEQATEVGTAVGAPSVSTGAHGGDSGPTPAAFNPATANSYAVECVRPFTVALRYVAPAMSSFALKVSWPTGRQARRYPVNSASSSPSGHSSHSSCTVTSDLRTYRGAEGANEGLPSVCLGAHTEPTGPSPTGLVACTANT